MQLETGSNHLFKKRQLQCKQKKGDVFFGFTNPNKKEPIYFISPAMAKHKKQPEIFFVVFKYLPHNNSTISALIFVHTYIFKCHELLINWIDMN